MSYRINRIQRVKDLRRVLTDRWGRHLPNNEIGRALLAIVLDHARLIEGDLAERMALQLLPDMGDAELAYMIDKAGAGRMWGATELAKALHLTEADRVRLGVQTIAAVDCTRSQRVARKRRLRKLEAVAECDRPALHVH
jgi:hypothetical protein